MKVFWYKTVNVGMFLSISFFLIYSAAKVVFDVMPIKEHEYAV
jgi:hypothetical protein